MVNHHSKPQTLFYTQQVCYFMSKVRNIEGTQWQKINSHFRILWRQTLGGSENKDNHLHFYPFSCVCAVDMPHMCGCTHMCVRMSGDSRLTLGIPLEHPSWGVVTSPNPEFPSTVVLWASFLWGITGLWLPKLRRQVSSSTHCAFWGSKLLSSYLACALTPESSPISFVVFVCVCVGQR